MDKSISPAICGESESLVIWPASLLEAAAKCFTDGFSKGASLFHIDMCLPYPCNPIKSPNFY